MVSAIELVETNALGSAMLGPKKGVVFRIRRQKAWRLGRRVPPIRMVSMVPHLCRRAYPCGPYGP